MPVDARWEPGITNAEPACRPSLAAVCLVIRTWSVAAGRLATGVPASAGGPGVATGNRPLSSRICGPNGCRSVTSILTGVPSVPGRSPSTPVNGTVIDDQSVLAGVRLTGARLKSACNEAVIVSIVAGEIDLSSWEAVSYDRRLCTSAQAAETLMVRVVGAIAASGCRAAWVLLARVSRAPAVAAKTARKVSRASQRYSPLGRYRRFTLPPPRGARRPGRGAGRRRAPPPGREAPRPRPRAGSSAAGRTS